MLAFLNTSFTLAKILPVSLLVLAGAYGGHKFMMYTKDRIIASQAEQIEQLENDIVSVRGANQGNLDTINDLQERNLIQSRLMREYQQGLRRIRDERDSYLQIFRDHDLTELARARPGLIEPRINSGTQELFDQLEQDTRPNSGGPE